MTPSACRSCQPWCASKLPRQHITMRTLNRRLKPQCAFFQHIFLLFRQSSLSACARPRIDSLATSAPACEIFFTCVNYLLVGSLLTSLKKCIFALGKPGCESLVHNRYAFQLVSTYDGRGLDRSASQRAQNIRLIMSSCIS